MNTNYLDEILDFSIKNDISSIDETLNCSICKKFRSSIELYKEVIKNNPSDENTEKLLNTTRAFLFHFSKTHIKETMSDIRG